MRKIVSIVLTVILVVAMCCVGISVSAITDKATIHVYDFYGAILNNKDASTHPELADKGVQRDTYTFDVGDVVNIEVSYYSEVHEMAGSALGEIYVNQTSIDPTSKDAFKLSTDGIVDTVKFSDIYYTSDESDELKTDGVYYSLLGNGSMCNPQKALEKYDEGWNSENDAYKDRCSYLILSPSEKGYSVATPNKVIKGITMVVTEASESYLYTALNGIVNPDITISDGGIGEEMIVTTTLKKVGHVDIEQLTEPATKPATEPVTEIVTEAPTLAPTEALTQASTELTTKPATEPVTALIKEPVTETVVDKSKKHTYTVVGIHSLCDVNWDPTYLNNDMIDLGNGVYQKVYTDVIAGDIEFKVAEDYSWENSFGTKGNAIGSPNCMDTVLHNDAIVEINFETKTGIVSWTIDYPNLPTEATTESKTELKKELKTKPAKAKVTEPVTEPVTKPITEPISEQVTEPITNSTEPVVPDCTYTVAGTPNLCGSNWDSADANNDMIDIGDGLFQKVYTGVNAGDIEFKIVENYSWDNSFGLEGNALGSLNCVDEVLFDDATVTISFDIATGLVTWDITYPDIPTEPSTEIVTELMTALVTELVTEPVTELVTEAVTELATELITEAVTDVAIDEPIKPTSATNPKNSTKATTAIQSPTNATENSTNPNQTTLSKVATGDASSVTILLGVLLITSGAVVILRKRLLQNI